MCYIASIMLVVLFSSVSLELLIYALSAAWRLRQALVVVPIAMTSFATAGLLVSRPSWAMIPVCVVATFRVINHVRVAKGRMNQWYLRKVTARSGFILGLLQVLAIGIMYLPSPDMAQVLIALAAISLFCGVATFLTSIRTISKTRYRESNDHYPDRDLPTVTICIPARNETKDLEDCLNSVLSNDYPKLEILVLDDCSQDKTAEIIRSFAHKGVRFIKGREPEERWLAKNQAYAHLADEANGEYMIFSGVDIRFGPTSVRAIVTTMLSRKKDMVSVLPRRLTSKAQDVLIQPMRYWWELALPRRLFNRPAVLSSCWAIKRQRLKKLGSFKAVSHAIIPEGFFARELVKTDDYSFLRASDTLDIQTRKNLDAQRETAIRVRYPQIRRRLELVLLMTVVHVFLLLLPFVLMLSVFWAGFGLLQLLAGIACILLVLTHVIIVQVSNPANVLVAALSFPLVVLTELYIGMVSMFRYEFSVVDWKGRNVCIPVMHTYSKQDFLNSAKRR